MAKGNLFLGTATNSIGDVTMMRRNGVQVSRVRVRKISNPKSDGQVRQRMKLSAVSQFYSPLSVCLETSFEGLSKSESAYRFSKVNLRRAEELGVVVPKDAGFLPLPFILSQGSLPIAKYYYDTNEDFGFLLDVGSTGDFTSSIGYISQLLKSYYSLEDGDQVTLITAMQQDPELISEFSFYPQYFRFYIDTNDQRPFTEIWPHRIDSAPGQIKFYDRDNLMFGFAVIFSRWENGKWRRSSQSLATGNSTALYWQGEENFEKYLPSWRAAASTPISNVYLNGALTEEAPGLMPFFDDPAIIFTGEMTVSTLAETTAPVLLDTNGNKYFLQSLVDVIPDLTAKFATVATASANTIISLLESVVSVQTDPDKISIGNNYRAYPEFYQWLYKVLKLNGWSDFAIRTFAGFE